MKKKYFENISIITFVLVLTTIFVDILILLTSKQKEDYLYILYYSLTFALIIIICGVICPYNIIFFGKSVRTFYPFFTKKINYKDLKYCYLSCAEFFKYDYARIKDSNGKVIFVDKMHLNFVKEKIDNYSFIKNTKFRRKYRKIYQFSVPFYFDNVPYLLEKIECIFIPQKIYNETPLLREIFSKYESKLVLY